MVFFAPMVVTTPNNENMHAKKVSHKIIDNACTWMQAARRNVLAEAVLAAVTDRRLTVTSPGRALDSTAKEKTASNVWTGSSAMSICFAKRMTSGEALERSRRAVCARRVSYLAMVDHSDHQ
jgi:hypothetical protein